MKNSVLRRWLMACLILTFGLSNLVAQTPQWVRDGILDASGETHSITTDAAGNVYVAFSYSDRGILAVAKLDPQGNLIWYDQAGTLEDFEIPVDDPDHVHTSTQVVRIGGILIYNDNGTERLFVGFDSQTTANDFQTAAISEYNPATGAVISSTEYIDTGVSHVVTDFKVGDGTLLLLTEDVLMTIDPSDMSISQQWQYGVDPAFTFVISNAIAGYQSGGTSPDFFGSQANPSAGEMPFFTGSPLANTKAPTSQDYIVTTPEVPIIYGQTVTYEDENDPNNNEIAEPLISEKFPAALGQEIVMRSVVETSEGLYIYYTYTGDSHTRQGIMKANKSDNYTIDWGYVWRQDNGNHGTILADQNNNIYLYSWDSFFYQRSPAIDILANKFDKNGNLLWAKTYGAKAEGEGDFNEVLWHSGAIDIDPVNQEIVMALYTDTFNQNTPSGLLLTTNYDGIVQNYTIHSVPGEVRIPKGAVLDGNGNAYVVYDNNSGAANNAGVFKVNTATVFLAPKMSSAAKDSDTQITVTFDDNVQTNGGNPTDFTVTDGTGANFAVSAQADGTAGDTDIVLTVASLSTAVGDLTVTYTNNNNEISDTDTGVDQDFVATDATGVTIDLDNTAPTVVSAAKDSDTQITVTMSEAVQTTGANPTDFTVTDANSTPFVVSAQADGTAKDAMIVLTVANLSTAVGDLTVTYTNNNSAITDFGSNNLATGSATISDGSISLMITEFLANTFGIESDSEWVELHNYGSVGIDINGFKLKDEDSDDDVITTSSTTIPAGGYLIIAKDKTNFESIWFGGNAVSNVLELSGLTMSNTTDELILTDGDDNEIWSLAYNDDETEGKATWISGTVNSPTAWGSKASPGIVRDGADNVSGSPTGYQKNNVTADPLAFTNTDGDMGSPLNGTVMFVSGAVDNNVSCNAGTDGGLTASALGGVSPYTYLWSNGATSANTTGLTAATFTITVTDANGLTATSQSTITQPAVLGLGSVVDKNVSINGGSDGEATASATGGTAPFTYSWNNGTTTATITGQMAGTYTVSVTDANGCGPAASQVTITEPAVLVAQTVVDFNVDCNGGTGGGASAAATGGTPLYTYLWSTGATTSSIGKIVNDNSLPAGTYTVTITDANGATATSSSTVTEPAVLAASVAGSTIDDGFGGVFDETVSCNGFADGGLTASGTGGTAPYTYAWSNSATTTSIVGVAAGTYTVTVTDNKGCTTTAQGTITEPDALVANASTDQNVSSFNGGDGEISSMPTGGTSPYTYLWSNGGTNAAQTALAAGTYSVTVTDANGCTTTESTTVTQPPNSDPEFDSEAVTEVGDDETYIYFIETSDADGHTVDLVGTTLPSWLSLENEVFVTSHLGDGLSEDPFEINLPGIVVDEPEPAFLTAPFGLAFDSEGDLLVADTDNNQIMRVSLDGFVTVFAGSGSAGTTDGTGTDASFKEPIGLVIDDNDNVYVADSGNDAIRKITSDGVVSTLTVLSTGSSAGTGTGTDEIFGTIFGITIDAADNLYVTSPVYHQVYKVTPGGVESVFAGSGSKTGNGPFGEELGDGTFADGTGTDASFNSPFGIDIDAQGNLYVADGFNGRVRKITPAGVVTTLVGSGLPFFEGGAEVAGDEGPILPLSQGTGTDAVFFGVPTALKLDGSGNIYLTQSFTIASVLRITDGNVLETIIGGVSQGTEDGVGTDAQFTEIFGIDIDPFGNLYISEPFTGSIREASPGNVLIGDPIDQVGDHPVVLDASDGNQGTAQQSFTITVFDNTAPTFESGTSANFAENGTGTVYTAEASDTNSDAVVTYHLGQGMDSQLFNVDQTTGAVTFINPPDYENPQDSEPDNVYKVELHASDDSQNSSEAFVVSITVTDVQEDVTAPDKPVITGITDDTGSSNTDGVTSDANIIISGTAEALSTVEVFTQYGTVRSTTTDANGDWSLDITDITLLEFTFNLTAKATDLAGNESAASDVFVLKPDYTAPAKPVITHISDDTGSSNTDGVTNDANIIISGTAEALSTVEVFTQYGSVRTTQTDANGDWSLDITDITLLEFTFNLTAKAADLAGNESATSDIFVLKPDLTAPAKPVITSITDDTGSSNTDGVTNDANIIVSGTAEALSSIEVFTQYGSVRTTQTDANGDWSLDITDITLLEFTFNLTAKATDLAGNESATSDVFVLKPDYTAPAKPVITHISDDTGSSNTDGVTNDANIIISGTAEALSTVEVSTQFGPVRTTQTDANGDWSLDITDITLVQLSFNLIAEATDLAGNTSAASDIFVLTPDFTAPDKPVITAITDDTGSSNSDGVTNDANIIISGTAEALSSVEVFTQYGPVRTTQSDANGDWSLDITDITLVEFTFNLTAKATDLAGNESVTSDVFVLKPDFTAPDVSIDIENNSAAGYLVTAIFDEKVSGLTLGEITVVNGIASALVQNSDISYSFLVNLSGSSADVTVNANSAEDQAGNGNTASNQLTLSFTPFSSGEDFTNLQSLRKAEEINIYPNPASKILTIDLSELSAEEVDIYMYDAAGIPVLTREAYKEKTLRLDVSNYTNGLYIVQFYDGTTVIRKKIMVAK